MAYLFLSFRGALVIIALLCTLATSAAGEPVEFRFRPEDCGVARSSVEKVNLAGNFNDWSITATPMNDEDSDGVWSVTIDLTDGEYLYKFVVNGSEWHADPKNPSRTDDFYGNSILYVGSAAELIAPASPNDRKIVAAGLDHDVRWPYLDALPENMWIVRLRTRHYDLLRAFVVFLETEPRRIELRFAFHEGRFDYWQALIVDPPTEETTYAFLADSGGLTATYDRAGMRDGEEFTGGEPYSWPKAEDLSLPSPPSWSRGIVWYQIFTDSFRNGDLSNDPEDGHVIPWTWDWWKPTAEEQGDFYHFVWSRRFGGDIQGVFEKLDYLQNLGVDAIYFNPMFEANSTHKYNTADYRHIDDNYGIKTDYAQLGEGLDPSTWVTTKTDRLFIDLVETCHRRGIHVILDGVFNHSGTDFWAWQDILDRGKASPYAGWYKIHRFDPLEYSGWYGFGGLPEYAQDENGLVRAVREHIFDITRRWLDPDGDGDTGDGVDGWRLDVPNLIADPFWREWRRVVKGTNPDAFISAEIWERATDDVRGDKYDVVMNYEFARRVVRFFINRRNRISVSEFDWSLHQLLAWYPWSVNLSMQNLLDSHDTDRVASMIVNPDREYDAGNRPQDGSPYNVSKPPDSAYRRLRLIVAFQMTFVGSPMIFYGDEAGMWGPDDPTCRQSMIWRDLEPYDDSEKQFREDLFDHYRTLIAIRHSLPALRFGAFETVLCDDARELYGFQRRLGKDPGSAVIVVLNASAQEHEVAVPTRGEAALQWVDLMGRESRLVFAGIPPRIDWDRSELHALTATEEAGKITLKLPSDGCAIIVRKP